MRKEELIKKWLDNELTTEELQEFKLLEEYDSFIKLSENAQHFKAPEYNSSSAYEKVLPIIKQKRISKTVLQKLKPVLQIAAIFIIGLVVYSAFFTDDLTTINTLASEKTIINLPDNSIAQLNTSSKLSFNKDAWKKQREVQLNGEAYFKVAEGSQFDVLTSSGVVSVLGTQFNVKNRDDYFEVTCYEGKVRVRTKERTSILTLGKTIRILNGNIVDDTTAIHHPTWIDNYSSFKSVPFTQVVAEFERQYNVKMNLETDVNNLFTGTFTHKDKKLALQSITIPLNLKYKIKENTIRIYE
ncbi:MAG: anti-sigma factor [Lutibacter sp.]|nr:MAG: anti-sigma factor [Lutibacter sp.]